MANLTEEANDAVAKITVRALFKNVLELKAQRQQANNDITTLQATIKADVANDVWTEADILALMGAVNRKRTATAKLNSIKTQFQDLKADLLNSAHQDQLQTEIDKL